MPVDLEMFLSQTSVNLFGYSHFVSNHFPYVQSYEDDVFVQNLPFPKNHVLIPSNRKKAYTVQKTTSLDSYQVGEQRPYRKTCDFGDYGRKKKVSFADDKGLNLVQIREIPSVPPIWSKDPLPALNNDVKATAAAKKTWKLAFQCPPWADEKLIELLETNKVVLETVKVYKKQDAMVDNMKPKSFHYDFDIIKERSLNNFDSVLEGTVKVKNIAYRKNVFIRISFDRWQTASDVYASYVKPKEPCSNFNDYDTFSFNIDIPNSALKYEVIEFCVGFVCDNKEFWDNDGGVNYRLITEIKSKKAASESDIRFTSNNIANDRITLSLTENLERFSEIGSWNNFMISQPYW